MKKVISAILSTVLVSAVFAATSVTLNNTATDIVVELNSDTNIYGIQFDLRYDSSKLSIDASSVTGAEDVYAADKGNGLVRVLMFDFDGQSLLVSRTGWTGELGIEIYGHAQLDHSALWDYLFKVGEAFQLERAGSASLGLRRIEAGILDYQSDIDLTMTPYDAGLGDYVDLSKGEFVGRQALEYVNKSCRLYGYVSETAIPNSGLEIFQKLS